MLMSMPRLDLTRTVPFELLRNHVELRVREAHDRHAPGIPVPDRAPHGPRRVGGSGLPARVAVHPAGGGRHERDRHPPRRSRAVRPPVREVLRPAVPRRRGRRAGRRAARRAAAARRARRRSSWASARGGSRSRSPRAPARSSASTRRPTCSRGSGAGRRTSTAVEADILGFDDGRAYGLVYCICGTLSMVLEPDAQGAVLEACARAGAPGAAVVIETHDPDAVAAMHEGRTRESFFTPTRGRARACCRTRRWTAGRGCGSSRTCGSRGAGVAVATETSRLTTPDEVDGNSRAAGLEPEARWGNWAARRSRAPSRRSCPCSGADDRSTLAA